MPEILPCFLLLVLPAEARTAMCIIIGTTKQPAGAEAGCGAAIAAAIRIFPALSRNGGEI